MNAKRSILGGFFRLFIGRGECVRVEVLISLASDNLASPEELNKIESHIAVCPGCRAVQVLTLATRGEIRRRPVSLMSKSLAARLADAIDNERRREQDERPSGLPSPAPSRRLACAGGALAIACAVLVVLAVDRNHTFPTAHPGIGIPSKPPVIAMMPPTAPTVGVAPGSRHYAAPFIPVPHRHVSPSPVMPTDSNVAALPSESAHASRHESPSPALHPTPIPVKVEMPVSGIVVAKMPPVKNPVVPGLVHSAPAPTPPQEIASLPKIPVIIPTSTPPHEAPTVVAVIPAPTDPMTHETAPARVTATIQLASNEGVEPRAHLISALRSIAHRSQTQTAVATTVALNNISERPVYGGTLGIVQASVP